MGYFKITTNPVTGLKDIEQVPTEEDLAREQAKAMPDGFDDQLDAALEADLAADLAVVEDAAFEDEDEDEDPPADPAANELMAGLYEQNVSWAKKRIVKIMTPEGVRAVREMEKAHPEFSEQGGRKGVLNALQERLGELDDGSVESDGLARGPEEEDVLDPDPKLGNRIPCRYCEFTAGSKAGMKAHVEAKHPDTAL